MEGELSEFEENGGRDLEAALFQHGCTLSPLSMTTSLYVTSDPYLGSFLLSQDAKLVSYEHVGPRRVVFRFLADLRMHGLLRVYWGNTPVPIVPAQLFASLREIKHHVRRRPGDLPPRWGQFPISKPCQSE